VKTDEDNADPDSDLDLENSVEHVMKDTEYKISPQPPLPLPLHERL
jgi:hypothetical protein